MKQSNYKVVQYNMSTINYSNTDEIWFLYKYLCFRSRTNLHMALQNALALIVTSLRHESQNTQIENQGDFKLDLLENLLHPNFTAIVKMYDAITTGNAPEDNIKNITEMLHDVKDELIGSTVEEENELLAINHENTKYEHDKVFLNAYTKFLTETFHHTTSTRVV